MKRLIGILAMLVLAGMLTACGGASGKAEDSKEKLSVMTTFILCMILQKQSSGMKEK